MPPLIANIAVATDPNVAGYRVFYNDGTQVDSTEVTLPTLTISVKQVQAVMVYEKGEYQPGMPYRRIYQGYDTYLIDGVPLLGGMSDNYNDAGNAALASDSL